MLREQYMRSGEGFVLVYDITNEATFRELMTFHERICLVKDTNTFPLVLPLFRPSQRFRNLLISSRWSWGTSAI